MKEFLSFTIPRQVVFFELGYDLTASNIDANVTHFNATTYGKMLANTPHAFLHLLNSCIYTRGRTTYIDFFPFFNPKGMVYFRWLFLTENIYIIYIYIYIYIYIEYSYYRSV